MRESVQYNFGAIVMTVLGSIIMLAFPFIPIANLATLLTLSFVWLAVLITTLVLAPLTVSVTGKELVVSSLMRRHCFRIEDIESIRKYPTVSNEMSLIFSYGFFGYWGWRREEHIGRYFSYYGKGCDTFLVIMRDGRSYRIGCRNIEKIYDHISSRMDFYRKG